MTRYIGPRLGAAALDRIKNEHRIVEVLARIGIDAPAHWDGHSDFRISPCPIPDCPGTGHNAASFVVHPSTNSWHCFRQDDGGDVLELVRQLAGTSLWTAAKILDSRAPITPHTGHDRAAADSRAHAPTAASASEQPDLSRTSVARVRTINALAWRYYTLPCLADRARTYLQGRGIEITALEAETGRPLAGYTPTSPTGLIDHLRARLHRR